MRKLKKLLAASALCVSMAVSALPAMAANATEFYFVLTAGGTETRDTGSATKGGNSGTDAVIKLTRFTNGDPNNLAVAVRVRYADNKNAASDVVGLTTTGTFYIPYQSGKGIKGRSYIARFATYTQSAGYAMVKGTFTP